ncbi:MAG TPA: hypothetical protein VF109_11460 [Mycobacteriales bacterium]
MQRPRHLPGLPGLPGRRADRGPAADEPGGDRTPGDGTSGDATGGPSLGELVARVADDSGDRTAQIRALAGGVARAARGAGRSAGGGVRGLGRVLADAVADAAPRIPVRDADTLRAHHPGRTDDEIAETLVRTAARATGAFGAAVGGLAAVEFTAPLMLLAAPVQLAAEALAVAAVEVKLVAELHELYGEAAVGTGSERGVSYLLSWMHQRAVDPLATSNGLATVLGYAAKRELQTVLTRRLTRSVSKLAPFLAGAVAGAEINRRATRRLGDKLLAELRGRRRPALPW